MYFKKIVKKKDVPIFCKLTSVTFIFYFKEQIQY